MLKEKVKLPTCLECGRTLEVRIRIPEYRDYIYNPEENEFVEDEEEKSYIWVEDEEVFIHEVVCPNCKWKKELDLTAPKDKIVDAVIEEFYNPKKLVEYALDLLEKAERNWNKGVSTMQEQRADIPNEIYDLQVDLFRIGDVLKEVRKLL